MLATLRTLFPRPVRITLYAGLTAVLGTEVTTGNLPAWALAFASAPLLALLHLTPADVDQAPKPARIKVRPVKKPTDAAPQD